MALCKKKSNKLWILKAYDRQSRRTIAYVTGKRDIKSVQKLYEELKHLKGCSFYTDDWTAFKKVLPSDRHIVGKKWTHLIECDNANTRHHLARFTRRSKVVSRSIESVENAIKLWLYAQQKHIFISLTNTLSSLF